MGAPEKAWAEATWSFSFSTSWCPAASAGSRCLAEVASPPPRCFCSLVRRRRFGSASVLLTALAPAWRPGEGTRQLGKVPRALRGAQPRRVPSPALSPAP